MSDYFEIINPIPDDDIPDEDPSPGGDNGIPGFPLIIVLFITLSSVSVIIIYYGIAKKRLRLVKS